MKGVLTLINISDKSKCCGCTACASVCPKKCISMKEDNEGFLYPNIDNSLCVNCGLCEKICPILNATEEVSFEQQGYIVQNKDEIIRNESTSGGAFSAIAKYIIDNNGIVYGASYDNKFQVIHTKAETINELSKFRNSKYVQSNLKDTFLGVEDYLKKGKLVCYSGTPCQIEGLKSYLRKDYDNLITVDIVCHAVPSPLIWRKYLEMQQENLKTEFSNIIFRDKHYGYKYSTMTFKDLNGKKVYTYGIDTDPMLRAFFSNICDRPSCYKCSFKKRYRVSDFTLWDCYVTHRFDKSLDDDKGTSRLLIHSNKGSKIFNEIKSSLSYKFIDSDDLTLGVKEMFQSVESNPKRSQFFEDAHNLSGKQLFSKYFPKTFKVKIEHFIRIFCYKLGIYDFMKKLFVKITNKY